MSINFVKFPSISTITDLHRTRAVEVQPETMKIGDVVYYHLSNNYHLITNKKIQNDATWFRFLRSNEDQWCYDFPLTFRHGKVEKICSADEEGRVVV